MQAVVAHVLHVTPKESDEWSVGELAGWAGEAIETVRAIRGRIPG